MHLIVGLGANLGSREANLRAAVALLTDIPDCTVTARSHIYDTDPVGPPQPRYLNAAVRLDTQLPPLLLLERLQQIEMQLGKDLKEPWGPRSIDLDILWSDGFRSETDHLHVPHPFLEERSFALAPLLDVAPELTDRYGARLLAIGGKPTRVGDLSSMPSWNRITASSGYQIEISSSDRMDAIANGLTVLARFLWGCLRRNPLELRNVQKECTRGEEGRVFTIEALKQAQKGFYFSGAVLLSMEPGQISGRLLGCQHSNQPRDSLEVGVDENREKGCICFSQIL